MLRRNGSIDGRSIKESTITRTDAASADARAAAAARLLRCAVVARMAG
jgi:hypothetical protein